MKDFSLWILLLSCLILQVHSFDLNQPINHTAVLYLSEVEKIGDYFVRFSAYSYCSPQRLEQNKCCHMDEDPEQKSFPNKENETIGDWTLVKHSNSSAKREEYDDKYNLFSVFRSDKYNKTVISFSGTKEFVNQLVKEELYYPNVLVANCHENDIKVCMGHYFYIRIKDLLPSIKTLIDSELTGLEKGYQLIVTGHSLGGASALIFLYLAVEEGLVNRDKNKPIIVTYGQPKAGNKEFVKKIENITEAIFRFVNQADIVPNVPPVILYSTDYRGEILLNDDSDSKYYHTFHYYNVTTKGQIKVQTPLSFFFPNVDKFVSTCTDLFDIIKSKAKKNVELSQKRNSISLLEESEVMTFEGEDFSLEKEIKDLYLTEIMDYVILLGREAFYGFSGAEIHRKYFKINVGSFCAEEDFESTNYVTFNYLMIFSLLIMILF